MSTINKTQIIHMSAEIIVFLTFGLYMNRKFKELKNDYESKFTQVNQKLDETNKKCDILFQMIQDIQQPPLMQPPSNFGLKRRRKIVSNVLPDDYEEPVPHQVQNSPQPQVQKTQQIYPKQQVQQPPPQPKNVEVSSQPFDLLSNIINIIEIAKPAPQPKSETKIEVIDENEEKEMDDEIQEELDSLLEENEDEDDN